MAARVASGRGGGVSRHVGGGRDVEGAGQWARAEVWPEPLRFRPERWGPARADHRKPGPHEFLPFGGGPHRCIGAGLATTELTVMLKALLQRPKPELLPQRLTPTSVAAMRPKHGLRIRAAG